MGQMRECRAGQSPAPFGMPACARLPRLNVPTVCRECGEAELIDLGQIADGREFAGQRLDPPLSGGRLWRCTRCGPGQRQPLQAAQFYEQLYASAPVGVWNSTGLRSDQRRVLKMLEQHYTGGDVLDVGCCDGSLLAALGPQWQRFGIEASVAAAAQARERGVTILGHRFSDLRGLGRTFDAIVAMDVMWPARPHRS